MAESTSMRLDRDVAADLKQIQLNLERRERRVLTLSEVVSRLVDVFTHQDARPVQTRRAG
jgi:hypothetical protein